MSTTNDDDSLPLIKRATGGDDQATAQLLFRFYDMTSRHIEMSMPAWMRRLTSPDDIVQEAFKQAYRDVRRASFADEKAFVGWLKRIASNRLIDAQRRHEIRPEGNAVSTVNTTRSILMLAQELARSDNTPSEIVAMEEACHAIRVRIAGLPETERQAIELLHINQISLDEVAKTMDRTPNAVRGLVHRAKKRLKEEMGASSLWFSKNQ